MIIVMASNQDRLAESTERTADERVIPLQKGETFPPIRSCNKGAWWRYIGSL